MARRSSKKARREYRARKALRESALLTGGSFSVAFLSQLISKDVNGNSTFSGYSPIQKAKFMANEVSGRIMGVNLFNDVAQFPKTLNPAGMLNQYTALGIGGILYQRLPIRGLPFKRAVGNIAKGSLAGGIFGGLFDAPSNQNVSNNQSYASQASYMNNINNNQGGGKGILS